MKTPETRRASGASFFQISQSNRRCVSGSSFQSTFDSRRRSIFRPCPRTQPPACTGCRIVRLILPLDLRLASPTDLPALPLELNLRLSSAVVLLQSDRPIDLRLAPPIDRPACPSNSTSGLHRLSHRPAHPSNLPSTCVAGQPSGPVFRTQPPTLVGRRISGSSSPADLRLAPPTDPLVPPSNSTSGFHRRPHLRPGLPIDPQLAPPIDLPALPLNLNSD